MQVHSSSPLGMGRRPFLAATAAFAGSWAVPRSFQALLAASDRTKPVLLPVKDEATGLELLQLPEGFRYLSFGWAGDKLADGRITPGAHDGMAVIADRGGLLTLCRNHEEGYSKHAFGPDEIVYDSLGAGGCTNLQFDTRSGKWLRAWSSLAGTVKNCAGGPTPWGTWLSCEETVLQGGDKDKEDKPVALHQAHGYVFEVPAEGLTKPRPLKGMGRFVHEAVAVDPATGIVYETEDRTPAGFYRYLPNVRGQLAAGGRLEMLKVKGQPDLMSQALPGHDYAVSWVAIEDPDRAHSPDKRDGGGVVSQGLAQGAMPFAKLEGCWWGNDVCYFVSSHGGRAKSGQIWQYDPREETLRLVFESTGPDLVDSPDNITVSPRGGIVLCEDGDRVPQKLQALSTSGQLAEFAWTNVQLRGERNGHTGDFRGSEWAGATFSPDGQWLFANVQNPGITFAITGPWESLGL